VRRPEGRGKEGGKIKRGETKGGWGDKAEEEKGRA
jgi:hypothetical protein